MRPRRRRWLLVLWFVACCVPLAAYHSSAYVAVGLGKTKFTVSVDAGCLIVYHVPDLDTGDVAKLLRRRPGRSDLMLAPKWFRVSGWRVLALPAWLFTAVGMSVGAAIWLLTRPRRPGGCRKCGYDLTGNVSGVCPECGTLIHSPAPPLFP